MINKIFNCISIHMGGGITYLSLMHHEIDKRNNLIFLDYRSKKEHKPFINAKTIYFKKNFFRNFFVFKERLKFSIYMSMFGLICNEFITIFTPGRGVFDWNDIVWTLMGGGVFLIIHRKINI